MDYSYQKLTYHKRGITQNILIKIVGNDYRMVREKSNEYVSRTMSLKNAEEVSQTDSCPIVGRAELRPVLVALQEHLPGLRARQTQIGTALSIRESDQITGEDADFLIACGSIAYTAASYTEETGKLLLSRGILPLLVKEPLPEGTFLFLEGIRSSIENGEKDLKAYTVKEKLEPVDVSILLDKEEDLRAILF
ncbi:MAG: hypothetical protein ACI4EG_00115 [Fusicatenibacter sp.]|nr:hypothetical protein [Fusicatenibacter sp.]